MPTIHSAEQFPEKSNRNQALRDGMVSRTFENARGEFDSNLIYKKIGEGGPLFVPAIEYIPEEEYVQYVFVNEGGIRAKASFFNRKGLNPDQGKSLFVITDRRCYLFIGDASGSGEDEYQRIPFHQITNINYRQKRRGNSIELEAHHRVYRFPLNSASSADEAVRYIQSRRDGKTPPETELPKWHLQDVLDLSWESFEDVLAELWLCKGYVANKTSPGPDGGVDIVAEKGNETVLIQAKQYDPQKSNRIPRGTVQRITGFLVDDSGYDPTEVVVATTHTFSSPAEDWATKIDEVTLLDGREVAYIRL